MKPVMQTKKGGGHDPPDERGDCVAACIASILGIPITAIHNSHGEGWWERVQDDLAHHGYCVADIDIRWDPPDEMYWIASVPSLNLPPEPDGKPALHCVVVKGRQLVHDPGISEQRYDETKWVEAWNNEQVEEGWALVPLAYLPQTDHGEGA